MTKACLFNLNPYRNQFPPTSVSGSTKASSQHHIYRTIRLLLSTLTELRSLLSILIELRSSCSCYKNTYIKIYQMAKHPVSRILAVEGVAILAFMIKQTNKSNMRDVSLCWIICWPHVRSSNVQQFTNINSALRHFCSPFWDNFLTFAVSLTLPYLLLAIQLQGILLIYP